MPDLKFSKLDGDEAISVLARAEMMRHAHEELSQLSASNRDKFAPFLKVLEEDVKRMKADDQGTFGTLT